MYQQQGEEENELVYSRVDNLEQHDYLNCLEVCLFNASAMDTKFLSDFDILQPWIVR